MSLLIELRKAVAAIELGGPKAAAGAVAELRKVAPRDAEDVLDQYAIQIIAAVDAKAWFQMTILIRDNAAVIGEHAG